MSADTNRILPPASALAIACLAAACAAPLAGRLPRDDRPNVVVLVADDLGWNDVGFHGSEIRTPRLDALARESVVLGRFYVYPTCSPSRAMLLTGRNPSRFGIRAPIGPEAREALPLEATTLAEHLATAGYDTGMAGKWHLGPSFALGPTRQGFRSATGYLHGQLDQFTHRSKIGGPNWFRGEAFADEAGHATDLIASAAVEFVRRPRRAPFFLYVAFSVPHYPLQEDDRWVKPYEKTIAHKDRRVFAGMVTHMDDAVGRVLDALDAAGVRDSTLVVFLSDNGGQRDWQATAYGGAHGPYQRLGDNRPLRGWKEELYEGGVRVPALAHFRGRLAPGTLGQVTSALDVLPTVLRLAAVPPPEGTALDGGDIWPLLAGTGRRDPPALHWNTGARRALLADDWKLIETRSPAGGEPVLELFHIGRDPGEARDLAAGELERVAAMRARLADLCAADPP